MAFTIFRADGTNELLSVEVGTAAANATTTIYDEDGASALANINIGNYQYLTAAKSWQSKIHSPDDTLATGSGNDFLVWDSGTTSNLTFVGTARDRLETVNPTRLLQIVDLGDGNDVVNFTARSGGLNPPGDYPVGATIFGGTGNDVLALGAGNDTAYGGSDVDTIRGGGGNDLLIGGAGVDSLFGGTGSDQFIGEIDAIAADGDYIVGWEGIDIAGPITIALSAGDQIMRDGVDGGTTFDPDGILVDLDTDTLFMQLPEGGPGARNVLTLSGNGSFQPQIVGIEVILASASADIINLSWYNGGGFAYDQNVSIFAGDGNDIVFSGDGNDRIVGDQTGGLNGFSDTIFGGRGNDTIFGDGDAEQPGQGDTIFGGYGHDTVFGGFGDDVLIDAFDGDYYGGLGSDLIAVHFSDRGMAIIEGGPEDTENGTDGSDRIYISGVYDQVIADLGQGDDVYIAYANENSEIGSGSRVDIVYGGSGGDLVSSWYGDDTIFGGPGDDVIWVGEDNDLVYGGDGFDIIYLEGGVDQAYGGGGEDYFYVMMANAQFVNIYDEGYEGIVPSASNKLILAGGFAFDAADEDGMTDGYGIYDLNHDLESVVLDAEGNPLDVVQMTRVDEFTWQIENLQTGSIVFFDQRDINGIALYNNDLVSGAEPGFTYYLWSETEQTYVFAG